MSDSEKPKTSLLQLQYVDNWGRKVFKTTASGTRCIDVDGELYTMSEYFDEPEFPINRRTADYWQES